MINKLKALREGGNVRRCHTMPIIGEYTVGKHSYDAANIVLLFHPNPSVKLVKAIMWHDQGERWVGDMPAPAKWKNPTLGEAYEIAEQRALIEKGIPFPVLTPEEKRWLNAVDRLELLLWAREQVHLGNRNAQEYILVLRKWFMDNKADIPEQLWDVVNNYTAERIPDVEMEKEDA